MWGHSEVNWLHWVDSVKNAAVDQTHKLLVSGKLVIQELWWQMENCWFRDTFNSRFVWLKVKLGYFKWFFRFLWISSRIENFGCQEEKVAHLKIYTHTHIVTLLHTHLALGRTHTHSHAQVLVYPRKGTHTRILPLGSTSLLPSEATCLFLLTNYDWVKHLQN